MHPNQTGKLSIIATPIGNLADITLRALETLKTCDMLICEDTRRTGKLLAHFEISKKLISLHRHSKPEKFREILKHLASGAHLGLVSDSGTPGIADPGNILIQEIVRQNPEIAIEPIPGPSSITALASISGLNTDQFLFFGFLPHKKNKKTILQKIAGSDLPVIFFESPFRIVKTLNELSELLEPNRQLVVGRELTKLHETVYRGDAKTVLKQLAGTSTKGEFVVIVNGGTNQSTSLRTERSAVKQSAEHNT